MGGGSRKEGAERGSHAPNGHGGHGGAKSQSSSSDDDDYEIVPPDGGWGWVVVLSSFIIHVIADGIVYSFGIFYMEFLHYYKAGRGETAWVGSLVPGVTLTVGPIASIFTNKYGCRATTIAGAIIASGGFALSLLAPNLYFLYFSFGIMAGLGFGLIYLPAIVSVGYYFEEKRAFATGLAVCGSGLGAFIFNPFSKYLIDEFGWRGAILIEAGIILNCVICGALFRPLLPQKKKVKELEHLSPEPTVMIKKTVGEKVRDKLEMEILIKSSPGINTLDNGKVMSQPSSPEKGVKPSFTHLTNDNLFRSESALHKRAPDQGRHKPHHLRRLISEEVGLRHPRHLTPGGIYMSGSLVNVSLQRSHPALYITSLASIPCDEPEATKNILCCTVSAQMYNSLKQMCDFSPQLYMSIEQSQLMDMFPEEAGALDPSKRIIPFLPGKKYFGRSHIREVAEKRMGPIADYCKSIVGLPANISQCSEVMSFFELDPEDINPPEEKKAVHGNTISNPKPLEVYVACTPYQRQEKGEVSLKVGMQVEIVEKTETGWWFVNVEDDQGWVPSSCLQREDGLQEDTTIKFAPGEEEQYLCTEMFKGEGKDELSLERGAVVDVVEKNLEGWWLVRYNGLEGYVPATYLVQTQALKITRKIARPTGGPEIVKSLHDISDLLRDKESTKPTTEPNNNMNAEEDEYVLEFKDDFDDGDNVYSIDELSKILRADNRGSAETDEVYESIHHMKSRSLKRSARPPPRSIRKNHSKTPGLVDRPPLVHSDSFNHEYVTVAPFSDAVGDGISFNVDEPVKVLQKSDNGWWYVEINNREGWAPASYIVERKTKTASSALQSSPLSGSRDDVTNSDEDAKSSGRRISGIGGLASALKSKLQIQQNKGSKSPPAPPRKDFLDDHHSNMSSASDNFLNLSSVSKAKSENDLLAIDSSENIRRPKSKMPKNTSNRPSMPPPAPPVKSAAIDNNPSAVFVNPARNRHLPAKPSTTSKPMPPVPPAKVQLPPKPASHSENGPAPSDFASALKAKLEAKEIDQAQAQGPISPRALKPAAKPKYNEWPRTSNETKEPESEDQSRCVSVSGLANALQAKFENKDSGITKPELSQKPKPFLPSKPSVDKKPDIFNAVNKPKPAVSNKTQHFNKPPDIKQPSNIEAPSQKVSDLANVLKAKFEKHDHEATADIAGNDRRASAVVPPLVKTPPKPKPPPGNRPQRPVAPPKFNKPTPEQAIESDSVNKSLDPKKYLARPLPPKPAVASEEDTKPSLPVKPKVAIKLTLEADVPGQLENYTEIEHDGNSSNLYRAIMAYNGGSEGEIALSLGQEVTLLEKADGWWYVSCHGVEGWAPAEFLEKVPGGTRPTLVADRVSIAQNVKKQNLYRACSEFVGQQEGELSVPCGAEVEVKEKEEEGWWFVKYNNQEGWVPSAYLTEM